MITSISREQTEETALPSTISYADVTDSSPEKTSWCWNLFRGPLETIGLILRNAFYLPLYKNEVNLELKLNQNLAEKISYVLQNPQALCPRELQAIRGCFSMRDIDVQIEGPIIRIFTVRLFESNFPIGEKKLRVILFSFNGNTECEREFRLCTRAWNPLTIEEVSKSPLSVLRAFQASGIRVDSLVTNSLGTLALNGLKYLPTDATAADSIPSTLIINRGLTSVKKVVDQLYPFPLNYILHGTAKLCGWNADPEKELLNFLERPHQGFSHSQRKVVIIEAQKDFYFSGKGALDEDIHEKIAQSGASVFRAKFWPYPFHSRAHHALTLDLLENNSETQISANTMSFLLDQGEKMSSAIARNIFLEGDNEWHTCFCVGGADATRDTGTVREVIPLLSAFIEEGEKRSQRSTGDQTELNAS